MGNKEAIQKAFDAGYRLAEAEFYNSELSSSQFTDIKLDYQDFDTWFYSLNTNAQ